MLNTVSNLLRVYLPGRVARGAGVRLFKGEPVALEAIRLCDFLKLDVTPREMLLHPILPEKSLAMVYAPRGIGKSWLALSIGLAVASGRPLLGWSVPKCRRVLYVDGEMPIALLQERLAAISVGLGVEIPNDGFKILAPDRTESGINLGTIQGRQAIERLLNGIDLLILDNLSSLFPNGSESAADAWSPMQGWLLSLRRRGVSVVFIHHAGTNGRQRGTSRREDVLDTVIALRWPSDYSPAQGARFEVHFEKIRQRVVDGFGEPFEARVEPFTEDGREGIRWSSPELMPSMLKRAAGLFQEGRTVREVAAILAVSRSEAGRLRQKVVERGLLGGETEMAAEP
jgi:putative DNA primase/helicase